MKRFVTLCLALLISGLNLRPGRAQQVPGFMPVSSPALEQRIAQLEHQLAALHVHRELQEVRQQLKETTAKNMKAALSPEEATKFLGKSTEMTIEFEVSEVGTETGGSRDRYRNQTLRGDSKLADGSSFYVFVTGKAVELREQSAAGRALRDWLYAHRTGSHFRVQATGRLEASPIIEGKRSYVLIVDNPVGVKILEPRNGK